MADTTWRIKSSTANAPFPKADATARHKTDRSRSPLKNSSSWLRRSVSENAQGLGLSSLSQQVLSENQENPADSTKFLGLGDEDDPDPVAPLNACAVGRILKAKTEALDRVNALLGENEDLLQSDPQASALPQLYRQCQRAPR